jgi:uncharacterized membrane protein
MTKLGEAKIYGGIGAILMLLSLAPYAGPILGLIGLILVFIAVNHIADETKNNKIFRDYLMNFIFQILAVVAVIVILIIAFGLSGGIEWAMNLSQQTFTDFNSVWNEFGTIFTSAIIALVLAWIFLVIGAYFLRKSYNSIAEHTKVNMFKTTGTVYFIGAITLIILIGVLILFVAKILEIVAYFSLPENLPVAPEIPKTEPVAS